MTYYAQRKSVNNGTAQTPSNFYDTQRAMQRQFHLFCANALGGDDFANDVDSIEWGTLEQGTIERKVFVKPDLMSEPEENEEPVEE